jgi:aromatic ring-opening dioxygenase catalytic subunit (LigB family)
MPAVSIFYGDKVITHPWGEVDDAMPAWKRSAAVGYGMDKVHTYRGASAAAMRAIEGLIRQGVDIGAASEVADPQRAGFGHAYGFIAERLFRGREYPMLPVLLNTYFRPNVPTAARCYDIGRMLRSVLEESGNERIAVIASGGLSHFVTDEQLDRGVLGAIAARDAAHLRSISPKALLSGSSEILNWILAAGALENLSADWHDYLPIYRTPAGSGIGMGFMIWQPT